MGDEMGMETMLRLIRTLDPGRCTRQGLPRLSIDLISIVV